MNCNQCGLPLQEQDRFCQNCGSPVPIPRKRARLWPAFLTLILIFAFGIGVFLLDSSTPEPPVIDNTATPWFTIENGILFFHKDRYTGGEELTVPSTVNGQTVISISDECFAYCQDLVMIHLPETVISIGDSAFYGCSSLRGIRLSETLRSIGDYAFGGCVSLEAVCIPYSLQQFGDNLFSNCHKLVYFFYPAPLAYWQKLPLEQFPEDSFVYCADGIYPAR